MLWYTAAGASERLRGFLEGGLGGAPLAECRFAFDPIACCVRWQRTAPAQPGSAAAPGAGPRIVAEGEIEVPPDLIDECAERF